MCAGPAVETDRPFIHIWNATTGALLARTEISRDSYTATDLAAIAINPDGTVLATRGNDGSILIFELPSCRFVRHLDGHTDQVWGLQFSPDGRRLLSSGGMDQTVRVWDWNLGQDLVKLGNLNYYASAAQFSPDGRSIANTEASPPAWLRTVPSWYETEAKNEVASLHERLIEAVPLGDDEVKSVLSDVLQYLGSRAGLELDPYDARLALAVATVIDSHQNPQFDAELESLVRALDSRVGTKPAALIALSRRLALPGQDMRAYAVAMGKAGINWAEYQGKTVVLSFLDTTATGAGNGVQSLARLETQYRDRGMAVLAIDAATEPKTMEELFSVSGGIASPRLKVTADPTRALAESLGIDRWPTMILIKPKGEIASVSTSVEELELKVEQSLGPPHAVLPTETLVNSIGMKLILIPAGQLKMGSADSEVVRFRAAAKSFNLPEPEHGWYLNLLSAETPYHRVGISRAFYLGAYEVTQGEYETVLGVNPSAFCRGGAASKQVQGLDTSRFPVENVSWYDAQEFCRMLSELPDERAKSRMYRLPTEAEREYACRAGTSLAFSSGESDSSLDSYAVYCRNSGNRTHPVGQMKPNAWGLFDMHGNVVEWCRDWFGQDYYSNSPQTDPCGERLATARVGRGGAYGHLPHCRSAFRHPMPPTHRGWDVGFRVVCEIRPGRATSITNAADLVEPLPASQQAATVDLKPYTNALLNDDFQLSLGKGNNLIELPQGRQSFAGIGFAIGDGLIQLSGTQIPQRPEKAEGIQINRRVASLYILHGTGWAASEGETIANYRIHFDDVTEETMPVVYGEDVRSWWNEDDSKPVTRGIVAWEGENWTVREMNKTLRLYVSVWKNPHPEKKVTSIDFISTKAGDAAPFCVAMTVEEIARRFDLPGNQVDVQGTTREGNSLDWAKYRGKTVLLWFCRASDPACQVELSNVMMNYNLYHDRGFEVVAISGDQDVRELDQFLATSAIPWPTLHDSTDSSGESLISRYEISDFPTGILVDKDGKVISIQACGTELGRLLAESLAAPFSLTGRQTKIDLKTHANQGLAEAFHDDARGTNNLAELPRGVQHIAGIPFDIGDAAIQLSSSGLLGRPQRVESIIAQCYLKRLFILHGTGMFPVAPLQDGTQIGEYTVHYEDGSTSSLPIVIGEDVRDWWDKDYSKPVTRGMVVWSGQSAASRAENTSLRLYVATWVNPHPEKKVATIDFASANTVCAPFCVAMTGEELDRPD